MSESERDYVRVFFRFELRTDEYYNHRSITRDQKEKNELNLFQRHVDTVIFPGLDPHVSYVPRPGEKIPVLVSEKKTVMTRSVH